MNMNHVAQYFHRVSQVLDNIPQQPIQDIIDAFRRARAEKQRIFIFGNGGSSATASHMVNDIIKSTVGGDLPRYKIICLSDNVATMTAYANDVSYDVVFAEPLAALAEPGDLAIAISGSGNSPNVLNAMRVAAEIGLVRIGLTGRDGGQLKHLCEICLIIPSDSMQIIEDAHLATLHAIFLELCLPAEEQ
jgi:D-sedoheptulose 7-phosphate isomerase